MPVVLKRVPPFRSKASADRYLALTNVYVSTLVQRGVCVVATDLQSLPRPDGSHVLYHVQPCLDATRFVDANAARRVAGIELSWEAAQASYREDRRMFPILLRIKGAQRMWIQRTGRQFDTLVPSKSTFG